MEGRVLVVSMFSPYTVDIADDHPTSGHRRRPSTQVVRRLSIRNKGRKKFSTEAQLNLGKTFSQSLRAQGYSNKTDLLPQSTKEKAFGSPQEVPVRNLSDFAKPVAGPTALASAADLFGNNRQALTSDSGIPPLTLELGQSATSLMYSKQTTMRTAFKGSFRQDAVSGKAMTANFPAEPAEHIRSYSVPGPLPQRYDTDTAGSGATSVPSGKDGVQPFTIDLLNIGNIGLFNAINACPRTARNRLFVGTLGVSTDHVNKPTRHAIASRLHQNYDTFPVFVTDQEMEGHYNQFCKQALWPMFHYILPEYPKSMGWEHEAWEACLAVNRKFAEAIVRVYREGDIIWVNDYHLMLLPSMLRQQLPNCKIGFFLHVPFPSSEIFRCLHVRKLILSGLLMGAGLIGFQTYSFARHFIHTCSRILSYDTSPKGIHLPGSDVSVGIFPIGIDPDALKAKKNKLEVQEMAAFLREKYAGKKVIIGRDKLDHVKGVRQKLLAFENFLVRYPEWHGKVVLIQIALSTTEKNELQTHVSDVVGRINSRFGSISYQPVVFLHQDIPFDQYLALLTFADAFISTSLRDGMNLTSHEYIICQEHSHNPLIISEFAGTYGLLGAAAIRVNPWDVTETAEAMLEALTMSEEERTVRWRELYRHVTTNTARSWVESFLDDLDKAYGDIYDRHDTILPQLKSDQLLPTYQQAQQRLLLFHYGGGLISAEHQPGAVQSDPEVTTVRHMLTRLTSDLHNIVYVLSGRTVQALQGHLGDLDDLGLIAENGCFIKHPHRQDWENRTQPQDIAQWQEPVLEILRYYMERTPGSWIEKKDVALVWHYNNVDNEAYGDWQAGECKNHIEDAVAASYPIHVLSGDKSLEVTTNDSSKALAVQRILDTAHCAKVDFILAVGNDRGDEEVFRLVQRHPHHPHHTTSLSLKSSSPTVPADFPATVPSQTSSPPSCGIGLSPTSITSSHSDDGGIIPTVFTCVVGNPHIKAQYHAVDTQAVIECLQNLTKESPSH
ncbi:Trehalose-6-P synthase/phosphatase complex subunit [Dispira simplex]|nr:Trehalose-6-P synthase/phosphatase complex subunit [Dispira simplex]